MASFGFRRSCLSLGQPPPLALAYQRYARSDALSGARDSFAKGVEITMVREGQVHARITARTVRESHARLAGPFRLGLAPSLDVEYLSIEILAAIQEGARRSKGHEIAHALRSLQVPTGITTLHAAPVRIVIQRKDGSQIAVRAARCSLSHWAKEMTCQKALVEDGDKRFRAIEARFDGNNLTFGGKRLSVTQTLSMNPSFPPSSDRD